jgi:hypothetical protein
MGTITADLAQAMAGLMAIEKRVIDLADERHVRGLRFEWNDDVDFGHMMDPVPVSVYLPGGRMVEAEFSLSEMAGFLGDSHALTDAKIGRIVSALCDES